MTNDLAEILRMARGEAAPAPEATSAAADCLPTADELWPRLLALRRAPVQGGETTHFPKIDEHFQWVRGKLIAVTGWPGHGKTEGMTQLMLAKSLRDGWQWMVFSPEATSTERMVNQWIETWTGIHTNTQFGGCIDERSHENAMRDVLRYVQPIEIKGVHTIDAVMAAVTLHYARAAAAGKHIHGLMLDPWNKLAHQFNGMREDIYVGQMLQRFKRFASERQTCFIVNVHPSGDKYDRKTMELIRPDGRNLQGGAEWERHCDDILSWVRPNLRQNPQDTAAEFTSLKIKDQKLSRCMPGSVTLNYVRKYSRYYQLDGINPMPPLTGDTRMDAAGDAPPAAAPYNPYAGLTASTSFGAAPDTTGFPVTA